MELYIMPGSCSLAPHIILHELGIEHKLVRVNGADKRTDDGRDYSRIVPQGYVPALQIDDKRILTEVAAILQYLADTHADKKLAAKCGTFERAQLQQWLSFIGTELHKTYGALFNKQSSDTEKQNARTKLTNRLNIVEAQLEKTPYIIGEHFTAADAYLYVVLRWADAVSFSLATFPAVQKYREKLSARKSVIDAKKDEGIA